MHIIIVYLFFLFSSTAYLYTQPTINKVWIGPSLEYLEINKKKAKFEYYGMIDNYEFRIEDSTCTFTRTFYKSGKIKKQREERIFKILHLSTDSLLLLPLNEEAKRMVYWKSPALFIEQPVGYDSNVTFQTIHYVYSSSFGYSTMEILIDSSGTVYFFPHKGYKEYEGLYKGYMNDTQLHQLKNCIRTSYLEKLPSNLGTTIDAPCHSLTITYDKKKINSEGCSNPPYIFMPLLRYLQRIYKDVSLKKTENNGIFDL